MRVPRYVVMLLGASIAVVFALSLHAARVIDEMETVWSASEERRVALRLAEAARIESQRAAAAAAREAILRARAEARAAALDAVRQRARTADYERARQDPLHFEPAISQAHDEQCLVCHGGVLARRPRGEAQAGVKASESIAWYQTLDTYDGEQDTLHRRHLATPFAKDVMNLSCNFCHRGHDPREQVAAAQSGTPPFTLRKTVNPSETCLLCHGSFPVEVMALPGPWHEVRGDLEDGVDVKNACLTCHQSIRTTRHQVTYLHAEAIERLAQESSDTCYGCHGGRAWYRVPYPYARNPWPDMDKDIPEWAKSRPTQSDPRWRRGEQPGPSAPAQRN